MRLSAEGSIAGLVLGERNRDEHPPGRAAVQSPLAQQITRPPCPVPGERVHAFVVLRHAVEDEDLTRHCANLLSDYKAPEAFHRLENTLPRNANGKVLKRDLRQSLVV